MLFESLLNRGSLPVLQQVMSFTEARHNVLANNISNMDTVGYKMKDLPAAEFFDSLSEAVERRKSGGAGARLEIQPTSNLSWDQNGNLQARPIEVENNIMFHDRNNRFVEKQMSLMAKNAILHNMAAEMLKQQYDQLEMAIRGRL